MKGVGAQPPSPVPSPLAPWVSPVPPLILELSLLLSSPVALLPLGLQVAVDGVAVLQ